MAEQMKTLEQKTRPPGPAQVPGNAAAQEKKRWHVGTLKYTAVGLCILFFWLLWGDFALMLKERSVPAALQLLFKKFHASNRLLGLLLGSLPPAIGIILGPIVSYRSDRHRGPWGRRIPFLLIPTPIAMLSMVGLAFSPALGVWLNRIFAPYALGIDEWTLICLGTFWTIFEICSIICSSVLGGLINDVVPRELLGRFFALFRVFSLLAGMLWTKCLLGGIEEYYRWIFVGIGSLYLVSFGAMCLMVKEGSYPDPEPPKASGQGAVLSFFTAAVGFFRECFSHPYYRWFFLSIVLAHISFLPINLFYVAYAKSMNPDMSMWGRYLTFQLFLSLLQALPLGWLCDRFHPIRVTMVGLVLLVLATATAFYFISTPRSLGITFVVCGTLAGFHGTATSSLPAVLLPRAKFATFASAMQVSTSVAAMIFSPLLGSFLDWRHEYRYIYLWCSICALLSLRATVVVYRKYQTYCGPDGYVAPEAA